MKKADETIVTFDGEVTSVNYTVTGLPSSSDLTIEGTVAAICGEGLRSTAKTFSYSFQTACAPVVLPLEESFENQETKEDTTTEEESITKEDTTTEQNQ